MEFSKAKSGDVKRLFRTNSKTRPTSSGYRFDHLTLYYKTKPIQLISSTTFVTHHKFSQFSLGRESLRHNPIFDSYFEDKSDDKKWQRSERKYVFYGLKSYDTFLLFCSTELHSSLRIRNLSPTSECTRTRMFTHM